MTENVDNLVLEVLRSMRSDMTDMKTDMALMRQEMVATRQLVAGAISELAVQDARAMTFSERLERIERRLEMADEG